MKEKMRGTAFNLPHAQASESSLVITWSQGDKMNDICFALEGYEHLLNDWGFSKDDVMALVRGRAHEKLGGGLRFFADCGGRVNVTPRGLS